MSQVLLEFSNKKDLLLMLSFAKRMDVRVVSVNNSDEPTPANLTSIRMDLMRKAATDPLFQADIEETTTDFLFADLDEL